MKFRPCIDIHEGVVKQIVGSTLTDDSNAATSSTAVIFSSANKPVENFVSCKSASEYAKMYMDDRLLGGHVIMLGKGCEEAALEALRTYPQGLHVGGGITLNNAMDYLKAGASHVIVTSYVFVDGLIDFDRLQQLVDLVGKERLVLDLSCRKKPSDPQGLFYVVTNKWTKYTDFAVTIDNLTILSKYCDEFLVHGVDVEGKQCGIEEELVSLLGAYSPIPVTYAGGVRSLADLDLIKSLGCDRVDCTVGSALDIFGGNLAYTDIVKWHYAMQ